MTLQPMAMGHAYKMLEWKNYPETRQFAIDYNGEISVHRHYQYLVTDGNMKYHRMIVKHGGEVVGSIRIKNNEVSIWIDRAWWKHGIATWILQHHAQDRGMTAKIVAGNIASMRAFIRSGFLPATYCEENTDHGARISPAYYIFKKV